MQHSSISYLFLYFISPSLLFKQVQRFRGNQSISTANPFELTIKERHVMKSVTVLHFPPKRHHPSIDQSLQITNAVITQSRCNKCETRQSHDKKCQSIFWSTAIFFDPSAELSYKIGVSTQGWGDLMVWMRNFLNLPSYHQKPSTPLNTIIYFTPGWLAGWIQRLLISSDDGRRSVSVSSVPKFIARLHLQFIRLYDEE